MTLFPKAQSHRAKFFKESKEVAGALDKLSAIALAFGFTDPTGATLSVAAAAAIASKAWDVLATGAVLLGRTPPASAIDLRDRRQTLIMLVVHEAYTKALAQSLSQQPEATMTATMPSGGACAIEDLAGQEDPFDLLKGRSKIFRAYEERLRQITSDDGNPIEGRDRLASEVTVSATQILSALLAQGEEPYRSLQTYLLNEAVGSLGALLSFSGEASEAAPTASTPVAFLGSSPVPTPDSTKSEPTAQVMAGPVESVSGPPAKLSLAGAGEVSEQLRINKAMFDKAKAILEKGQVGNAQTLFETVAQDLAQSTIPDAVFLRARAIGNVGHCLHRLGRNREAAPYFREGHKLAPQHLRMRVNLALAELTEGNPVAGEAILRDILAEKADEPDVIELLADSLSRREEHAAALEVLKAHPRQTENYFCMLSLIQGRLGFHEEALVSAKAGITKVPEADYAEFCAAMALVEPILDDGKESLRRFESGSVVRLAEAVGHLERAVAIARKGENIALLRLYLSNLCGIYGSLGRRENALKAGEEARALGDASHQLNVNLFAAQINLRRIDDAITTARLLRGQEPLSISIAREMHANMADDRYPAMIAVFDETATTSSEVANDPQLVALRIHAQRFLPDRPAARAALTVAFGRFGRDPHLLTQEAHLAEDEGDHAAAEAAYLEAEGVGTAKTRHIARIECGLYYYRRRQYAKALDRIVAPSEDPLQSESLTEYLVSLHHLKRYPELAEAGLRYREARKFKQPIWELTAVALAHLGRLPESQTIHRELVQHLPSVQNHLALAGIHYRRNAPEQAITVLESARAKFPKDFYVNANLSGLYFVTRQYPKSLEAAKRAYRLAPKRADAHAGLLRFLTVGDRITLSKPDQDLLQEVLLKADSIQRFNLKHLPDGGIDFTEMVDVLKEPQKQNDRIREEYHKKRLPVSVLANALSRDLVDTWFGVTHGEGERLFCALGTVEEQEAEGKQALEAAEVVLDGSALLTLQYIGLLSLLPKLYSRIYVPNALRERFVEDLHQVASTVGSAGSLRVEDDKLRLSEIGSDYHDRKLETLRAIVAFLESPAVTVEGLDQNAWREWQELRSIPVFADWMMTPMLLAQSKRCALLSDEHAMRLIAREKYGVPGFWTQAFLRAAAHRRLQTLAEHNRSTMRLVALNYDYVSITDEMVADTLAKENHARSRTLRNVFRLLESGGYSGQRSASLMGGIAGRTWFNSSADSTPTRQEWLDACVTSLSAATNRITVLIEFTTSAVIPLIHFPESVSALFLALAAHPRLTPEEQAVVREVARRVIPMMAETTSGMFNPRLHAAWVRLAEWQKLKARALKHRS